MESKNKIVSYSLRRTASKVFLNCAQSQMMDMVEIIPAKQQDWFQILYFFPPNLIKYTNFIHRHHS